MVCGDDTQTCEGWRSKIIPFCLLSRYTMEGICTICQCRQLRYTLCQTQRHTSTLPCFFSLLSQPGLLCSFISVGNTFRYSFFNAYNRLFSGWVLGLPIISLFISSHELRTKSEKKCNISVGKSPTCFDIMYEQSVFLA
jgi:hypothetical protein